MENLKCYGMYIDSAEVFLKISTGEMDNLLNGQDIVGVYQDPYAERQVLIFNKKEQVKSLVKKAKELGFDSVEMCPTMIYVPEDAVNDGEFKVVKNESNNGDRN